MTVEQRATFFPLKHKVKAALIQLYAVQLS